MDNQTNDGQSIRIYTSNGVYWRLIPPETSAITPTNIQTKKCTKCSIEKPIEGYNFRNVSTGKRHNECRECVRVYQKSRDNKNHSPAPTTQKQPTQISREQKTCCRCKTTKARSEFSLNTNRHDGMQAYCKSCSREVRLGIKSATSTPVEQKSPAQKCLDDIISKLQELKTLL